uniref:flagellar basal body P-ring formation chaperone FlgA n=1 Tax=Undibacterium sp. TaxID=1914977 RepID=UPI003751B415
IILGSLVANPLAQAQQTVVPIELSKITQEVETFLKQQTSGLNNRVEIQVRPIDPRLKLQACEQLSSFLPPGAKVWGKVTVGIRCNSPKPWTIYASAQVRIFGDYVVTKNAVRTGQILTEEDIVTLHGELSSQAAGVALNTRTVVGKTMLASYPAGVSIRQEMFKTIPVIQQGQSVKVVNQGTGFRVSNDAIALNSASEGQIVRGKTTSGILVNGIARAGGLIEVQ